MLNQNPKPYFNQVAMIESQYESKRRNLTNSNNASLLQNKSPLRERESTPSLTQTRTASTRLHECILKGHFRMARKSLSRLSAHAGISRPWLVWDRRPYRGGRAIKTIVRIMGIRLRSLWSIKIMRCSISVSAVPFRWSAMVSSWPRSQNSNRNNPRILE